MEREQGNGYLELGLGLAGMPSGWECAGSRLVVLGCVTTVGGGTEYISVGDVVVVVAVVVKVSALA